MKKLQFPAKKTIILSFPHNIEAMFYTEFTVYTDVFPTKKIDQLISENYNVIYFDSKVHHLKPMTSFLLNLVKRQLLSPQIDK